MDKIVLKFTIEKVGKFNKLTSQTSGCIVLFLIHKYIKY